MSDQVDYWVVAVLGCQSTGKSTLLNRLFGTNFAVMNQEFRQQTTRGVWLGKATSEEQTIFVCDVEGSDGRERGESKKEERKIALFSLALAEVLIINMNAADVGRHEGANLSLFKCILELNTTLFLAGQGKPTKKLLLFVFRDWNRKTVLENLSKTMKETLENEWSNIQNKPDQFKNSPLTQFFDFEFVGLSNYDFAKEKWDAEVDEFRDRFDSKEGDLLKSTYRREGVPFDGFAHYIQEIWSTIQTEKDLDLPTQREMLSKYRCDAIANESFKECQTLLDTLNQEIREKEVFVSDFGAQCAEAYEKVTKNYSEKTRRYQAEIAQLYLDELSAKISSAFGALFHIQIKTLARTTFLKFESALSKKISSESANPEFKKIAETLSAKTLGQFHESVETCLSSTFSWSAQAEEDALKESVLRALRQAASLQINFILKEIEEKTKSGLGDSLSGILSEASPTMWKSIKEVFVRESTNNEERMKEVLKDFGHYVATEHESRLKAVRDSSLNALKSILESKTLDIDRLMFSKFKKSFGFDENGMARSWGPDDDIAGIFKNAKNLAEGILDLFCVLRLDETYDRPVFFQATKGSGVVEVSPPVEVPASVLLLKKQEANRALERFRDSANAEFILAKKDQEHAQNSAAVPQYMVILLLVLGANEIWWVLSFFFGPVGYLLLALLALGGFAVWKLNLTPVLKMAIKPVYNNAVTQVKQALGLQPEKRPIRKPD